MSRIVAQFDPSAKSGSFSAAAVNRCSALLFMNESANFLTLDFGGAFPSTILQPWSNRLIRLAQPVQTVNWTVAAALTSSDAPVSQVYVEAFDPSETLDGIVSGPLFRQANVGNQGVATQITNDSNAVPSQVIETRPINQTQTAFVLYNDGTVDWWVLRSDAIWQEVLKIINQAGAKTGQLIFPGGFASTGNGAGVFTYDDGLGNLTTSVLHATAPVQLISGHQETGMAGLEGTANAGNNVSLGVNFKTVMTNTPTSLTLTTSFSGNTTSQTATGMTKYGFWLSVKATANGDTYWAGTYTTVGNCLLAVDTTAQTFDHHCDACGAVHRAQSFSTALMEYTPLLALSYLCPACGARDCFNTAMSAADEADTTPQGSGTYATTRGAQATLIRQLMTVLGLPTA